MRSIRIGPAADIESLAAAAFDTHRARIVELLPEADVEHVGATSVPGALTKGDVDLLVRVDHETFSAAATRLANVYAVHQPQNWTSSLASFIDPDAIEPPVGVQLVIAGSPSDQMFGPFRDELINDPALLAEYNALKQRLDGEDYERYTAKKGAFVERVLREVSSRQTRCDRRSVPRRASPPTSLT